MDILKYTWLLFPVLGWAQISEPSISTYSIVARDQQTGEIGVAVQSKFIAVGAVVPYAQAEVGAIASQAWGNPRYGPVGLDLLARGKTAEQVIRLMTEADPNREHRQLAVIGTEGNASIFTGKKCNDWAGGKAGFNYAVQGNLLAGAEVIHAMSVGFEEANGTLAERMIASLHAGQQAGGDKRGKQSAALLIVKTGWGYGGLSDRFRDLRVDDHPSPIKELERIYYLHRNIFPRPDRKHAK
ncbi:DUF1028 domain-containing protein [Opitutales bacterium]|nr:DUF1028 domain-containing protein [Opitutales bacterium]